MSVLGPGPEVEYLVELVAYDPDLPGERTLRYSTIGKTTGPAETPANTFYDGVLKEPGDVERAIAAEGALFGRAKMTLGDLVLTNKDGALDALAGYAFDGRALTVRRGTPGAAYPAGYPVEFRATMDDVEVTRERVRVRVRDAVLALDTPLQTTKYAGDNTLPDGLEGVEGDVKGKPKPLVYGVVKNVAPPFVNTAKRIYQVNDGAVASVDGVYDRGHSLGQSPNGWDRVSHGEGEFHGRGAAASPTALLLCGYDGSTATKVLRTTDGSTFADVTGGSMGGTRAEALAYGAGVHVLIEWDSPDIRIWTSADDGDTWTERSLPASWVNTITAAFSVRWHETQGVFVITAMSGAIATSPTGETWTARTSGVSVALWDSASDGARIGIGGGDGGAAGTVLESLDDGATWAAVPTGLATADDAVYSIAAARDEWVIGTGAGRLYASVDFRSWTRRESALNVGAGVFTILHDAGWWVAGAAGNITVGASPDVWEGATFLGTLLANHLGTFELAAFGGRFWGVGEDGYGSGDRGVWAAEAPIEYADLTELVDDDLAPEPGNFGWVSHANGSYVRLGSPPAGLITADVTQGATSADRTAGSLFEAVLTKAGYTSADWNTADVTALDVADNGECGLFVDEEMTVAEALDRIAASVGAWWGVGADGKFRIVQFAAPSGAADLAIAEADILAIERLPSDRPTYSTVLRYARNYTVQASDLALGVSDARRAELAREWREATSLDAAVQTTHLLAQQVVEDTLFAAAADAEAEADRRQALRGVKRDRFAVTVALDDDTAALDVGDVVEVTHSRFGLSAGRDFRIIGMDTMRADRRLRLTLWA